MEPHFENPRFPTISYLYSIKTCESWRDNFAFWLRICAQKGKPEPFEKMWKEIIHATNGTIFENNMEKLLLKIHEEKESLFQLSPIHAASKFGDLTLVQYMIQNHMAQTMVLDEFKNR